MTLDTLPATTEHEFLESLKALKTDRLFVYVELDRLKIDPAYQRTVKMQRVRKMASTYNEDLMGVLVCSVREDGIYVIDGQHRLEVARMLGHPTVRCELRVGLTRQQEAAMFYHLDTDRVALSGENAYKALLMAGDPVAQSIQDAIDKSGFTASFTGPIINGVRAFKTLIQQTGQHGAEIVGRALRVLHNAWPDTVNAAPAQLIEGMVFFLQTYPDVSDKELSRALNAHTSPNDLLITARTLSGSMAWNTKTSMGRAILGGYNHHRSSSRLEDRFSA